MRDVTDSGKKDIDNKFDTVELTRFLLRLVLVSLLAVYIAFNYNSVRFTYISLRSWLKGHVIASAIADQIVIIKYPFSPLSSIARVFLSAKVATGHFPASCLFDRGKPIISTQFTRGWTPTKIDVFALLCIIVYGICGTVFSLLSERKERRKKAWIPALVSGFSVLLFYAWSCFVGNRDLDASYAAVALFSILWTVYGIVLLVKVVRIVRNSGDSVKNQKESTSPAKCVLLRRNLSSKFCCWAVFVLTFAVTVEIHHVGPTRWEILSKVRTSVMSLFRGISGYYVVNVSALNMRKGPGISYGVICVLKRNTKVKVIERREQWGYIETDDGKRGWVALRYMKAAN